MTPAQRSNQRRWSVGGAALNKEDSGRRNTSFVHFSDQQDVRRFTGSKNPVDPVILSKGFFRTKNH